MFQNFDEALKYVRENDIQRIDLKWSTGRWHHVSVFVESFTANDARWN